MKILIVSQYFWPEEFRINDLAVELTKNGYEITVLTGIPNYPQGCYFSGYGLLKKNREIYNGIKIKRVPLIARGKGGKWRLIFNYFSFALLATLWAPFVCRGKFDIIFVFEPSPITVGLPAILLKRIKKIPIFFWVQDLWPESLSATGMIRSAKILKLVERLTKYIYKQCDQILIQSRAFTSSILAMGVPENKIKYFPNAAEDLYKTSDLSKKPEDFDALPEGFRIMYTGNIGAAQSFETMLGAAVELQNHPIQWIIIGDGREKVWLKEQVARLKIEQSVHLIGRRPIDQMPYYLNEADALLLTLKKDPVFALTIPSKLQSYFAAGRPILAAIDGEAGRLVEEAEAGLVAPAEDAKSLAEKVLIMYNASREKRKLMGQSGQQYFETHFNKARLIAQLEKWMKQYRGKNR